MRAAVCMLAATLLAGCDNACQQLCVNLAEYGEESCDYPYDDAQVEACVASFDDASSEDLRTCDRYGTPDVLRREWTCDDVRTWQDIPE